MMFLEIRSCYLQNVQNVFLKVENKTFTYIYIYVPSFRKDLLINKA